MIFSSLFLVWGPHPAMLEGYSQLCAHEFLSAVLREPHPPICKACNQITELLYMFSLGIQHCIFFSDLALEVSPLHLYHLLWKKTLISVLGERNINATLPEGILWQMFWPPCLENKICSWGVGQNLRESNERLDSCPAMPYTQITKCSSTLDSRRLLLRDFWVHERGSLFSNFWNQVPYLSYCTTVVWCM